MSIEWIFYMYLFLVHDIMKIYDNMNLDRHFFIVHEEVDCMQDHFLARTLRETRMKKAYSQERIALEMGIARKTVQNWERGSSAPSIEQAIEWFRILEISPLPYLFQYVYPDMEKISASDDDKRMRVSLLTMLAELPPEGIRQLLYLFYGDHGSSPRAILNLMTAHLQTPIRDRVVASHVILKNYEMSRKKDENTSKEHIHPDVDLLRDAISRGEDAVVHNRETYVGVAMDVESAGKNV